MSIVEFFRYLIDPEPTRELALQVVEVYDERAARRTAMVHR